MARKTSITAAEAIRQLEADPEWVSRRDAREQDRVRREQRSQQEQRPLLRDLEATGTRVSDVWDLVNTPTPYPRALPVLLAHLMHPYGDRIREGIARALALKEARPLAWEQLISLIGSKSLPKQVADGLMVALSAMARPTDLQAMLGLISDSSIGASRIFLVRNLMRSKKPEARQVLVNLRDDPDLRMDIAARLKMSAQA